jgi:tetratricopeptide (TPR) repeat protein
MNSNLPPPIIRKNEFSLILAIPLCVAGFLGFCVVAYMVYKEVDKKVEAQKPAVEVRELIASLDGKGPDAAYNAVFSLLDAGKQHEAEDLLDVMIKKYNDDQRLVFVRGVCKRSRFSVEKSHVFFIKAIAIAPTSYWGKCSSLVIDYDTGSNKEAQLALSKEYQKANTNDIWIAWISAVLCRDYYKETDSTNYSQYGASSFQKALNGFSAGPVMIHQTYANIIAEELGQPEQALKHRKLAVEMEPRPWTYQGMANTLNALKRYDEANEYFAKMVELDPSDDVYWESWGMSLYKQKKYLESIEKLHTAVKLGCKSYKVFTTLADNYQELGMHEQAAAHYKKALTIKPDYAYARRRQSDNEIAYRNSVRKKAAEQLEKRDNKKDN